MLTRRQLLAAGTGLVLAGCRSSDGPAAPGTTTSPTTVAGPTAASTTTTTTTAAAAATTTTTTPAPWAGADFVALDAFVAETAGAAFLIAEQGRVVHEWYRDGDPGFRRDVASAQKSIVALLVGRAVDDGLVTADTAVADVLGPSWTPGADAPDVTVRHLLSMTSGLDHRLTRFAPPGTVWQYSNAFARLADVLEALTVTPLDDLARAWLFEPAGASGATFYARRSPGSNAPFGLSASARDLAGIGALVLAGGAGAVSTSWIETALAPSQDLNPSYGYLWWLNGQDGFRLPGPGAPLQSGALLSTAPPDVVAALGKDDQKLYVSRQLQLVVVRLGDNAEPASAEALSAFDDELWSRLLVARG